MKQGTDFKRLEIFKNGYIPPNEALRNITWGFWQ